MSYLTAPFVAKIYHALRPEAGLVSDAELLRRFVTQRDETSFELLLWRHGPMVWGVCRRVLGHTHDAEDAFQASFLALARKARMIGEGKSLPGWLYRVSLRAALAALKARRLRRRREEFTASLDGFVSNDDPVQMTARHELAELLDGEIALLPEKFRLPFILCELQGRRRAEVAAELQCPLGTVESRLNRARAKLRNRLAKRGLVPPLGLTTLAFPRALRATTVRLALSSGAAAPASVALLTDQALHGLAPYSLKLSLAGVLSVCLMVAGIGQATLRVPVNDDKQPSGSPVPEPNRESPVVKKDDEPLPKEALARVGSTRFRHGDIVTSMAYSPDGKWVASASRDGTARVWDSKTGHLEIKVPLDGKEFPLVGFARKGKSLLVVDSQSVRIIDLATGKEQTNSPLGKGKRTDGGAVAADGSRFLLARDRTGVQLIDAESGKEIQNFSVTGNFATKVGLALDGKSAVVTSNSEKVPVLDVETGKTLHEFSDDQRVITAAAFSPDGKTLATLATGKGEEKDRIVLWDLKTEKPIKQMDDVEYTGSCLAFSPDGQYVATGNLQRLHLQLFDVGTGKEVKQFRCRPSVLQIVFSPDGKTIAASKYDGNISLYDVKSGKMHPASPDVDGGIGHLHFTNGGKNLLTISGDITERDWKTGQVTRRYPDVLQNIFSVPVFSPDGTIVVAYDTDGAIRLIDGKTGKEIRKLLGHTFMAHRAIFSPDGSRLFSRGNDSTLRFWDVKTGKELANLPLPNATSGDDLAVSPDGRTLVTSSMEARNTGHFVLRLWDVKSAVELRQQFLPRLQFSRLAFSPDSTWVACVGGEGRFDDTKPGTIFLWNTATGRLRALEAPLGMIFGVAFSPDGRTLATGGNDHMARLWEVASGKERHCFHGHNGAVGSVAFSSDGALLASCSPDAPIYIWDVGRLYDKERRKDSFTEKDREDCWDNLANLDTAVAFETIQRLLAAPDEAVNIVRKGFKVESPLDAKHLQQLLRNLDSDNFEEREKATDELTKVADAIEPLLVKTLETGSSSEVKLRVERILESINKPKAHSLRIQRTLEILERLGTPEALEVLEQLAAATPQTQITDDAKKTLERLRRKSPRE